MDKNEYIYIEEEAQCIMKPWEMSRRIIKTHFTTTREANEAKSRNTIQNQR